MEAHLTQIERVNPKVNAIITLLPEQAMDGAKAADEALTRGEEVGPLHGLPVAHKDLVATRGIRTTMGSPIYKDSVPNHDELIVERLKRAGAITIGKTNTPEFGAGAQTYNEVFGETLNPYDTSKTCAAAAGVPQCPWHVGCNPSRMAVTLVAHCDFPLASATWSGFAHPLAECPCGPISSGGFPYRCRVQWLVQCKIRHLC